MKCERCESTNVRVIPDYEEWDKYNHVTVVETHGECNDCDFYWCIKTQHMVLNDGTIVEESK